MSIEPGTEVGCPAVKQLDMGSLAHAGQRLARLIATPRETQRDDVDSLVGARFAVRRVEREQPFDVAVQEQRLLSAGGDVRIEAPGLGVRGK